MKTPINRGRAHAFARHLPAASKIAPKKTPPPRMTSTTKTAAVTAAASPCQSIYRVSGNSSLQYYSIRSFSTRFREDYDDWYSHGLTGVQTQSDQRGIYFGDNADAMTFGVQPQDKAISETEIIDNNMVEDDYDLEDAFLDYSEAEFESWFPPTNKNHENGKTVNAKKLSIYHLDFEGNP